MVPMQFGLLLKRRAELPAGLEEAMLHHHGENAYHNGYFWLMTPKSLPDSFVYSKTRRWFHTFNYINQFRGSAVYLAESVNWLMENQNPDGLWDWGPRSRIHGATSAISPPTGITNTTGQWTAQWRF